MESKEIFIAVGQALFAVLGSCVKWLNKKDDEPKNLTSLLSEGVSAAFSGMLVYLVFAWLQFNVFIAFAVAGIIGNQGAKGLDLLGRFIIRNSGLDRREREVEDEELEDEESEENEEGEEEAEKKEDGGSEENEDEDQDQEK